MYYVYKERVWYYDNYKCKKGNTVIISKAKYNGLLETVHLIYVPKIKKRFEKDLFATEKYYEDFKW